MAQFRKSLQPQFVRELVATCENGGADYLSCYQVLFSSKNLDSYLNRSNAGSRCSEYLVRSLH